MRLPDWQTRLHVSLDEIKAEPVQWAVCGATCLHLLQDSASAMTGRDIAGMARQALGPAPTDERSMLRYLVARGGVTGVIASVAAAAGFPEISPDDATEGDWAVTDDLQRLGRSSGEEAILRVTGGWAFRLPDLGIVCLPAHLVAPRAAWAVG